MGGSSWSNDHYAARTSQRAESGIPAMAHDADAKAGKVTKLHPSMDVRTVKMRESRDSATHPNSLAVAFLLDVTGSMNVVPVAVQKELPTLLGLIMRSGTPDPQILIGAIGDANTDDVPVQIGQFESGIEIDDNITNLYLEGNGGGQNHESYELLMWFMLERTAIDCLEKRGEKGFLFIVGDERFYPKVSKQQIAAYMGNPPEADMDSFEMIQKLLDKYEVFFIMPKMTQHYGDTYILEPWKKALHERVLMLDEPSGICQLIASTIAVTRGADLDHTNADLKAAGTSIVVADSVSNALRPYAGTMGDRPTALKIPSSDAPSGLVEV